MKSHSEGKTPAQLPAGNRPILDTKDRKKTLEHLSKREITMPDGRYMIFYAGFVDESSANEGSLNV